jgi:hypothetical protein
MRQNPHRDPGDTGAGARHVQPVSLDSTASVGGAIDVDSGLSSCALCTHRAAHILAAMPAGQQWAKQDTCTRQPD